MIVGQSVGTAAFYRRTRKAGINPAGNDFRSAKFTLQEDRFPAKKQWKGCVGTAETILL